MLTKVVLPAPLLPIRLTRSPAAMSIVDRRRGDHARRSASRGRCALQQRVQRHFGRGRVDPQRADAARQEADHEQQEQAERELPGVREVGARERAHDLEHGRLATKTASDALPAGEDRDEDELARGRPVAEVRVDVAERHHRQRAAACRRERREHEVDRHRLAHRAAEVLDAQLVLAHRERHQAARAESK